MRNQEGLGHEMSFLHRITIRQLLVLGIVGLIILAVAPALRMLSGLTSIQTSNRLVQETALPLSKTVSAFVATLQSLDNLQLRYLSEANDKADRVKEIEASFLQLKILIAKMRFGSQSAEYRAERQKHSGALPHDHVQLPSNLLKNEEATLVALAGKVTEAERGFANLKQAHEHELALLVTLGKETKLISSVAADILVDFRAWVSKLEQAAEYAQPFDGNTDMNASLIGAVLATTKVFDPAIDRNLRSAERLQRRILNLALAINRADAAQKISIFQEQGRQDFKRFETALAQLITSSTEVVNASRNAVQTSLRHFQTIGADVFQLEAKIQKAAELVTDQSLAEAQQTMESTAELTWLLLGVIVALAPLFGVVLALSILRPLGRMAQATEAVAKGQTDMPIEGAGRRDEIGRMAKALVVFQGNIVETQRLRAEQLANEQRVAMEKAADMEKLAASFESSVLKVMEAVAHSSASMRERAVELSGAAHKTSQQATDVAATANQTAVNVRTVAVATDELSASVRNIAEQTANGLRLSEAANRHAEESAGIINSLDGTVQQIGDVVSVISHIASQTNLLALNATIEAARAGEAGRGFAVVANEVKALAAQTAKATDDITAKIQSVQVATTAAVQAISEIGNTLPHIAAASSVVAQAMTEQEKATREIAGNVDQAALGVENVTRVINDVAQIANGSGTAAADMLEAAEGLLEQSRFLREEVTGFLAGIRAA
jgi:methyl-accepting chemotaxis protein